MGMLADAIRDRRKRHQRRMGFGAATVERQPEMLVGTFGVVDGADLCIASGADDFPAEQAAELELWGAQVDQLTAESVTELKDRGAAFAAFELDGARADALLEEDMDFVLRLHDSDIDESHARALASLRPAAVGLTADFPLSLTAALSLRRVSALVGAPLGMHCPSDVSAADLEVLRDCGVAVVVLGSGVSAEGVAAVKQRVADLPERKQRRDDDAHPLIPTSSNSDQSSDGN